MFLAPRQRKTTLFTRFWASASKNHSIYSVLWPGPSKNTGICAVSCMLSEAFFGCQRHKNIVNYTIFTRGQYQKIIKNWPKIDQKTPNKDLQNASANFTLFSPTPNPQKRENPSRLRDFRGGSAAPARPRVAKAMLSNHHRTASPDLRAAAPAADPGQKKRYFSSFPSFRCWSRCHSLNLKTEEIIPNCSLSKQFSGRILSRTNSRYETHVLICTVFSVFCVIVPKPCPKTP